MSLLRRAVRSAYPQFNQYTTPYSMSYGSAGYTAAAGERVDETTALGISTVLACVSLLADTVASMRLTRVVDSGGRAQSLDLPSWLAEPDPENSDLFEYVHTLVVAMGLHGNSYTSVDRGRGGEPVGLVALHPYQMQVLPGDGGKRRRYLHLGNELDPENVLHGRWLTPPQSLVGVSPLVQARTLFGLSLAMDRHLANWYANGATPSSVLETDKDLSLDQARILQATWESTHGRGSRRPAVLSDGLKWRPVVVSASDQQLEQMRMQTQLSVAQVFRVPAHMLGIKGDSQTYQNVEQASLNFLTHTIQPWLRRIEVLLSRLLPPGEQFVFDTSTLLRLDAVTKARVDVAYVGAGAKTPNEVRQGIGYEPYAGGDVFNQALAGAVTAGGALAPSLGVDEDQSAPVLGVV